jgi:hypothetical protein
LFKTFQKTASLFIVKGKESFALEDEIAQSFEMLGTVHPSTKHYIPEDLHPQQLYYDKLRSYNSVFAWLIAGDRMICTL